MAEQWGIWIDSRGTNYGDTPGWATDDEERVQTYPSEKEAEQAARDLWVEHGGIVCRAARMN